MTSAMDLPEHLPGFDIQAGVARVGGNAQLYRDLLQSFYREKRELVDRLNQLLEAGEQESAQELVHSVKGVAGNLSATDLFTAAKELENSLKQPQPDNLAQLKGNFESRFNQVMETLHNYDQSIVMQQESAQEAIVLNTSELQAGLQELADMLDDFSMDAGDCFARLRSALDSSDEVEQLSGAINDLDFDSASELLKKISGNPDRYKPG